MDMSYLKIRLSNDTSSSMEHFTNYKHAAVLVLIFGTSPNVLMIKKSKNLNIHAGEIAFPGGKFNADVDLLDTALRETREEVGLNITREQVIGQLDSVITLNSGYMIKPFIAISSNIHNPVKDSEVESIFNIPLETLLNTLEEDVETQSYSYDKSFKLKYQNLVIWGATARILYQIAKRLDMIV